MLSKVLPSAPLHHTLLRHSPFFAGNTLRYGPDIFRPWPWRLALEGKYDMSLSKLQEALDIRIMALGADHIDVSSTQYKMALVKTSRNGTMYARLARSAGCV